MSCIHLLLTPGFRTICQAFSYAPLNITKSAMISLVTECDIDADFAPVVMAFGEPTRISEPGYGWYSHNTSARGGFRALFSRPC